MVRCNGCAGQSCWRVSRQGSHECPAFPCPPRWGRELAPGILEVGIDRSGGPDVVQRRQQDPSDDLDERDARVFAGFSGSPWLLPPAIMSSLGVRAFNFIGDGLRDAADPYVR